MTSSKNLAMLEASPANLWPASPHPLQGATQLYRQNCSNLWVGMARISLASGPLVETKTAVMFSLAGQGS